MYYRAVGRKDSGGMNFVPCMEVVFMNGNVRLKGYFVVDGDNGLF